MSTVNVDRSKEFTCISLCSGYGGIELGLQRAIRNLRTVVYVEIECFACANLVAKMEAGYMDAAPIWTDLKTFDGQPFRGRVDIITGGYPCQPWSHAGKRQGEDDPRHLWPYIAEIVRAVQPVWCFFENVAGHLSLGFPAVYRSLRELGYAVEAGLFTAAQCGAPHKRQRLFILAHNERAESGLRTRQESPARERGRGPAIGRSDVPDAGGGQLPGRQSLTGNDGPQLAAPAGGCDLWPAPPGQPQYEWEEPRVVGVDANNGRNKGRQCIAAARSDGAIGADWAQAESPVGQSIDGRACGLVRSRVDQLRLLGNGVVPTQAERAFRRLYSILNTQYPIPNTQFRGTE